MRKPVTLLFTILAVVICFIHYLGYDPKNLILISLSIPLWVIPLFTDIAHVNLFLAYGLTIASWALLGYIVDRYVFRAREKS
ncbi:hypothetical protein [Paenibacillus sp. J2TS4]|uniref:hypothetical protein n=1 Tax=Paenibacillus sp. J2TS4 TaxID=2807194 RepID=UPI001B29A152|nr:hypothetical protein [Paenibacillus sp. J2TS4]GIP36012.1 hypothetical protein J2TS4_52220 [Paenibacillus sp. J2TS4]